MVDRDFDLVLTWFSILRKRRQLLTTYISTVASRYFPPSPLDWLVRFRNGFSKSITVVLSWFSARNCHSFVHTIVLCIRCYSYFVKWLVFIVIKRDIQSLLSYTISIRASLIMHFYTFFWTRKHCNLDSQICVDW